MSGQINMLHPILIRNVEGEENYKESEEPFTLSEIITKKSTNSNNINSSCR